MRIRGMDLYLLVFFILISFFKASSVFASCPSKGTYCNSANQVNGTYCDSVASGTVCTCKRTQTSYGYSYYWSTSSCSSGRFCSSGVCVQCTGSSTTCSTSSGYASIYTCSNGSWKFSYECTYGECNGSSCKDTCCNRTLSSSCASSLSSSQMCKSGSTVGSSAYLDYGYPDSGKTSWRWSCNSSSGGCAGGDCATPYCVPKCSNGSCGSSNGKSVCSWSNLTSLCGSSYGTVSSDTGGEDGTFNWSCSGQTAAVTTCHTTGTSANCSATKIPLANGQCGAADGSCAAGTVSDVGSTKISSDGIYSLWSCNGICGGSNTNCEYKLCNRVDGACGSAINESTCSKPSTALCSTTYGNSAITTGTDTFTWNCNGTCSGAASSTCTSTRLIINGECGVSNGGNFISTPTSGLCQVGTASSVTLSGTSYSWTCNRNCNGTTPTCSATYDTAPTLLSTVLKTTSGTVVPVETGNRNHSCETSFAGSQISVWTITGADANGVSDIKEISLRFRSAANTYAYGPTTPVNGVVTFTIDTSSFVNDTYQVEVLLEDVHSSPGNRGWLDTGRDYRAWDCQVTVDGTIYDNSTKLACNNSNNQGFTQTISNTIELFEMVYGDISGENPREMTVVPPKFLSPETLTWQNEYFLTNFKETDTDFLGVFESLKIGNTCVIPRNSHISPKNYINPYTSNPVIQIKYSAVMDQENWFRVEDGTVIAKTMAKNYVPVTCSNNCVTTTNGLIWSKNVNIPKSNDNSRWSEIKPQTDSNSYLSLKYDVKSGLNVGTTFVVDTTYGKTALNWSEIKTSRGIVFIDGNFIIDENIDITSTQYLLFVVSGNIEILDNVTLVEGMLFSDKTITAAGDNNNQLIIKGSLYGKTGITLSRSYTRKRDNNLNPSIRVIYDPNLIFKLPNKMWERYENWRME